MALVARLIFYPTLWWNMLLHRAASRRWRWWDWVDEHVLLGALPFSAHVRELKRLGIGAVINTCREYEGPLAQYKEAGIDVLALPTVDFTPPSLEHLRAGVRFIQAQAALGRKVYVHCKAGRGRSATLVMCYLVRGGLSPREAQNLLLEKRPQVMPDLYLRKVVREFAAECAPKTDGFGV